MESLYNFPTLFFAYMRQYIIYTSPCLCYRLFINNLNIYFMLQFKKYSSIENHFDKKFMEHVKLEMPGDLLYVVQEKVHGTNVSFLCDGKKVKLAKRTDIIADDENFYEFAELVDTYKSKVIILFNEVKEIYPEITSIAIFGEMFGGLYPHHLVRKNNHLTAIQKGVFYTPNHDFYAFDILIHNELEDKYLAVDEVNSLFEKVGFFYAKTLFKGTLNECLNYPNDFQSKISGWLGLPQIEDNICEGVVIRPTVPMFFRNGKRVIIKSKNDKFSEKKTTKKSVVKLEESTLYSDMLTNILCELESFVTENRLNNVASHIGEVSMPRDFGKLIGLMSKDVFDDFMKQFEDDYNALDKEEQKVLTKKISKWVSALVKKVYIG